MSMNPMMIKASPEKYIRTFPALLAALIRLAEGVAAVLAAINYVPFVLKFYRKLPEGMSGLRAVVLENMPELNLSGEMNAILDKMFAVGSAFGMILISMTVIVTALFLVILLCMMVEGAAAVTLRFLMKGAGVIQRTQRLLSWLSMLLVPAVLYYGGYLLYDYMMNGGTAADKSYARLSVIIGIIAVCLVVAATRARFHRDLSGCMRSVSYELRMGYKEINSPDTKTVPLSLLYGVLLAGAAAVYGIRTVPGGADQRTYITIAALGCAALKYFMLVSCAGDFKLNHM